MKARFEAAHGAQLQRQEVEEERAVRLRGQGDQLSLGAGIRLVIDVLEVRGLAAQTRTVIDDLAIDFARCVVDESHLGLGVYSLNRLSMSSSVISANGLSKALPADFFSASTLAM